LYTPKCSEYRNRKEVLCHYNGRVQILYFLTYWRFGGEFQLACLDV
jgi:hypothetical protein